MKIQTAGWYADQESANGADYFVIGKYAAVTNHILKVCVTLNAIKERSYQVFLEKSGNESVGYMSLVG